MKEDSPRRLLLWILAGGLCASLALNGYLFWVSSTTPSGRADAPTAVNPTVLGRPFPFALLRDLQPMGNPGQHLSGTGPAFVALFSPTDCQDCLRDVVFWNMLDAEFGGDGLRSYAISCYSTREETQQFLRGVQLSLPVLCDPEGLVLNWLGIDQTPVKILVDPAGKVCWIRVPAPGLTGRRRQFFEARSLLLKWQQGPTGTQARSPDSR